MRNNPPEMYQILVVEDFKGFNDQLKILLETMEHQVDQAFSINEATELLSQKEFDFILLDLMLPDGEGESIVYQLRYGLEAKIIVLTADDDIQRRDMLFGHGILDYVSKLNHYDYISNEIEEIIEQQEINSHKRILIVDDSGFIRNHIASLLRIRNYEVQTAKHGKEAIEILMRDSRFDLIVLDLEMPEMSGEEVLKKMVKDAVLRELPVLVLSGTDNKELIARVLKHGANDYMKKPFSIEEMVLRVQTLIQYRDSKLELTEINKHMQERIEQEVTRFQKQERLMLQQSRLAAMGEMIGNIAHQWRQPLNALSLTLNKLELAQEYGKITPELISGTVAKANTMIRQMSQTIDDFKDFYKEDKAKVTYRLLDAIQNVMMIMEGSLHQSKVSVQIDVPEDEESFGIPNELQQVLLVLLSNAKDAIHHNHPGEEGKIHIFSTPENDTETCIYIQDNGGGVPENILEKIFDPYFTTKQAQGTGIGLYMSKQIIEGNMKGSLRVENMDNGARFCIRFPKNP